MIYDSNGENNVPIILTKEGNKGRKISLHADDYSNNSKITKDRINVNAVYALWEHRFSTHKMMFIARFHDSVESSNTY